MTCPVCHEPMPSAQADCRACGAIAAAPPNPIVKYVFLFPLVAVGATGLAVVALGMAANSRMELPALAGVLVFLGAAVRLALDGKDRVSRAIGKWIVIGLGALGALFILAVAAMAAFTLRFG